MTLIVAVVTVSLLGSFLCSLCEAALYGVTPTQVEVLRRRQIPGSGRLGAVLGGQYGEAADSEVSVIGLDREGRACRAAQIGAGGDRLFGGESSGGTGGTVDRSTSLGRVPSPAFDQLFDRLPDGYSPGIRHAVSRGRPSATRDQ